MRNSFSVGHLYFFQDLVLKSEDRHVDMLLKLHEFEILREYYLYNNEELRNYKEVVNVDQELIELKINILFHLTYISLFCRKEDMLIGIERKQYKLISSYIKHNKLSGFNIAFVKHIVLLISEPLNELLIGMVKLLMCFVYIFLGWTGRLKKCIR